MHWPVIGRHIFLVSNSTQPCGVEAFSKLLCESANRAGSKAITLPLSSRLSSLAAIWSTLGRDAALVCNLPVVAWKRHVFVPLVVLAMAWLRGSERVIVLHEWADLSWRRRAFYLLYGLFASDILLSSPHVQHQFGSDGWTALL